MLSHYQETISVVALGVSLLGTPSLLRAQEAPIQLVQAYNNSRLPNPQSGKASGSLQVTGTSTRFTISANHADVQEVLKLIFDQAEKQFVLEGNLSGTITLRLNEQPLGIVLPAVCRQAFLKFRFDAVNGIFTIERDEASVRAAFSQLKSLDAELRNQLRLMGLSLPGDQVLANGGVRVLNMQQLSPQAENVLPGGSFVGRSNSVKTSPPVTRREGEPTPATKSSAQSREQGLGAQGSSSLLLDMEYNDNYEKFLRQNNFVYFNIPKDKPEPILNVLQLWSKQANIPILVDPNVPRGSKFVVRGTIPPRPIMDALNSLVPYARLEWRWAGNSIFVSTTPEFDMLLQGTSLMKAAPSQGTPPSTGRGRGTDSNSDKRADDLKDKPAPNKQ